MTINIKGPELRELKPRILVLGVGGAGGNALNGMIEAGMEGVEFVAVNTDAQDLKLNKAHAKIQLGSNLTKGLGAGAKHEIGQAAAEESLNDIVDYIKGSNMVFITAGMGGGTGTGAAHVIARAAKELNILTVGVVTLPFSYEGPKKMRIALQGLEELKKHLDTNIIVPNQNLFKIITEKTTFKNSFGLSNDVLKSGVQSVTDLMVRPGLVNLDFADVETIMKGMGKAMMGTGEAEGEKRAEEATNAALNNPLIDEYSLKGAKGLLVNITGGDDLTMFEVDEAVNKIRAEVDPEAELIFGSIEDENLNGKIRVSIVATSLDGQEPDTKPVISMVHRLNNRNIGYSDSSVNTAVNNQATLNATEGATALNINHATDENKAIQGSLDQEEIKHEKVFEPSLENISIESATYIENTSQAEENIKDEDQMMKFEVDSIELATPELSSNDMEYNLLNQDTNNLLNQDTNEEGPQVFENSSPEKESQIKEPEMFEESNSEEDFEIPAFLRRQKN
ncbi:MAG: cell division protein FtsZ [Candidatus Pelagibacterales bacterium]|nr:MAG: cell division protein FtsZ [Pelagibacterales bacterium]